MEEKQREGIITITIVLLIIFMFLGFGRFIDWTGHTVGHLFGFLRHVFELISHSSLF